MYIIVTRIVHGHGFTFEQKCYAYVNENTCTLL
jgi:hypothetical protein